MLQCGDIVSVEVGGPGYRFADELTGAETYPRGTVAMGNQGPDTNGSQFFVVHSRAQISPAYTVLGRVTHGMSTLDRIVAAGIEGGAEDGPPAHPVRIRLGADLLTLGAGPACERRPGSGQWCCASSKSTPGVDGVQRGSQRSVTGSVAVQRRQHGSLGQRQHLGDRDLPAQLGGQRRHAGVADAARDDLVERAPGRGRS